jgi:hypothetical protein
VQLASTKAAGQVVAQGGPIGRSLKDPQEGNWAHPGER